MNTKNSGRSLSALTGAVVLGMLATGCSVPAPPDSIAGGERASALADSAYNSMIDDPTTGMRDWKSPSPDQSGIAYWHVGWVSKKGSSGASVEYAVATAYHRVTRKEVVEVVIPQSGTDVAYELRMLPGAPEIDEVNLAADIERISKGLARVLGGGTSSRDEPGAAACVGGKATYKRPPDNRTLRRCRLKSSAYGPATGSADKPSSDPIVVFLNIALDIAKTVQDQAHCEPDVRPLDDEYRDHPSSGGEWAYDCSNGSAPIATGADPAGDPGADGSGRTAGSSCPEVGKVCFSSDGSKRGTCGADHRCWR